METVPGLSTGRQCTYLMDKEYSVDLVPFDIGARGYVTNGNAMNLINIFVKHKIKTNVKTICKNLGKIFLLCTFAIFHAFQQPFSNLPVLAHHF